MALPPQDTSLDEAFRLETARLVRARFPMALGYYLVASVLILGLEWRHHPERATLLATRDAVDMGLALAGLLVIRTFPRPPWPTVVSSALVLWIVVANAVYSAIVGNQLERYVMIQVVILNLTVVLFPWGWRGQVVPVTGSLFGFAFAAPYMRSSDAAAFCTLALCITGVASVLSARFYDRYRRQGFEAQAHAREEAEIAAALHTAATALAPLEGTTDVLETVTRIATASLRCDFACALRWDPHDNAFRLVAALGLAPEAAAEMRQLDFGADVGPAVGHVRAGAVVEIADGSVTDAVPPALLARWQMASLLAVPMRRGGEVGGVLVAGYRTRRGPFDARHHRLQAGLAQMGAVALENVRLVTDLRTASRFKSEFVSTVSHELRTPLNVILGFAEIARDTDLESAERVQALERVEVAARELFSLIEDTLEMGRIESGRDAVRLQQVALRPLLAELEEACGRLPRGADVALRWRSDVPDAAVLTDPRKITVIVRNLVGNACKFTEHGHVTVWTTMTEGQLVLTVADTGIGIAAADRDAIFEMFRQGDSSDSRRFGGLGLGLHITRRFVQQLGGTIDVSSETGKGSVFSVKLPVTTVTRSADAA
jgi:signal transduction histidine kinase